MKLLALFLIVFPINCFALTFSEIRSDARSLITDAQGTRQRFSDSELNLWINEGQRILDIKTLCNYKAFSFDLVAGTTYYSMPSDYLMIRRVTRDYQQIQEMSPAAMDGRSAEWENVSGLPTYYFTTFSSRAKVGFAPFPAVAADTATIKIEYMSQSTALSIDADVPFNGITEFYPYHSALSYYSAYKASLVDERYDRAKLFIESFNQIAELMKNTCTQRPNYLPSAIGKQ